jgi:hypothetical protein
VFQSGLLRMIASALFSPENSVLRFCIEDHPVEVEQGSFETDIVYGLHALF